MIDSLTIFGVGLSIVENSDLSNASVSFDIYQDSMDCGQSKTFQGAQAYPLCEDEMAKLPTANDDMSKIPAHNE